jgi:hypothetical protein
MKKLLVLTGIATLALSSASFAGDDVKAEMKKMCDHHFMEMDTNKDNKVSKAEHDAFANTMFKDADTNNDGSISKDEKEANFEKMMDKAHTEKHAH